MYLPYMLNIYNNYNKRSKNEEYWEDKTSNTLHKYVNKTQREHLLK